MLFVNAVLRTLQRKDSRQGYREFVEGLAEFDRKRKGKPLSNQEWESPADRDARVAQVKDGTTRKAGHAVELEAGS